MDYLAPVYIRTCYAERFPVMQASGIVEAGAVISSAQLAESNIAVCLDGETNRSDIFYQLGEPTIVSGEFVAYMLRQKGKGLP